jgi:tubulysin polyketide synthase-like protein
MSAALLARLTQLGVSVEREGDRLLLDGPEETLTEALIAEVAAAKPSLLSIFAPENAVNAAAGNGVPVPPDLGQGSPIAEDHQPERVAPAEGAADAAVAQVAT